MSKKSFQSLLVLILVLMAGAGQAFVPQAPHLLYMMTHKIVEPVGIEAVQVRTILDHKKKGVENQDFEPVVVEEKLIYAFPGRFRSQVSSGQNSGFSIESDSGFIRVINGHAVASEKSPVDLYTDILLYRDYESLLERLALSGIDTETVTFVRYNDTICYLIGHPTAGLWIDKESLMPVKYAVKKDGWSVEFYYENWQRVSRTWYPMSGSIFLDNRLFAIINVKEFILKSQGSESLFDVAHARQVYPENQSEIEKTNQSQMDELDRSLENFKQLYE